MLAKSTSAKPNQLIAALELTMILHIPHSSVEIPEQFRNQIVLSDADNDTIGDVCDPEPGCGGCGATQCETEC
jgi:hypothetical protein